MFLPQLFPKIGSRCPEKIAKSGNPWENPGFGMWQQQVLRMTMKASRGEKNQWKNKKRTENQENQCKERNCRE